jgi:D-alanine-D-alanine ligase
MVGQRLKVAVLMGGTSAEREVSLRSGEAVASGLLRLGYEVHKIDLRGEDIDALDGIDVDIAFITLHGGFGEDGRLQAMLEQKGIAYTGSGPQASALAMDKLEAKRLFMKRGLFTPSYLKLSRETPVDQLIASAELIGYPLVIKPRAEGSSIGVSIHQGPQGLLEGFREAARQGPEIIVERYISGRELTVSILEGKALPIIELRFSRRFFDYKAKYEDKGTAYIVSPRLGDIAEEIKACAVEAFNCLGCEGFGRVDMILSGTKPYILEVNSVPGLTERSLLPKAARAAGIEFPELCERIVLDALRKRGSKSVASLG